MNDFHRLTTSTIPRTPEEIANDIENNDHDHLEKSVLLQELLESEIYYQRLFVNPIYV